MKLRIITQKYAVELAIQFPKKNQFLGLLDSQRPFAIVGLYS